MNNEQTKTFCLNLIKADKSEEVIELLKEAGYWNNNKVWRYYSDFENNFNVIGNQQSTAEAALVEKLVNAVDARLMSECLVRKIDPEGPLAPKGITEAIALFYEDNPEQSGAGNIRNWDNFKRNKISRDITLSATGYRDKNPCFTISDRGEGQVPEMMSSTFLSTKDKNKLCIKFVQGKFNMGGTGALTFCGPHNLQLIVSRRNTQILNGNFEHEMDNYWGFTIVRREDPDGIRRSSVYTYLAPLGAEENPGKSSVLRFKSDSLPIFPEKNIPYAKPSKYGTLIKLGN